MPAQVNKRRVGKLGFLERPIPVDFWAQLKAEQLINGAAPVPTR